MINRRTMLAALPASTFAASMPEAAQAHSLPDLVNEVMRCVVPARAGYVYVKADSLAKLCEATGVQWGQHWYERKDGQS